MWAGVQQWVQAGGRPYPTKALLEHWLCWWSPRAQLLPLGSLNLGSGLGNCTFPLHWGCSCARKSWKLNPLLHHVNPQPEGTLSHCFQSTETPWAGALRQALLNAGILINLCKFYRNKAAIFLIALIRRETDWKYLLSLIPYYSQCILFCICSGFWVWAHFTRQLFHEVCRPLSVSASED